MHVLPCVLPTGSSIVSLVGGQCAQKTEEREERGREERGG